MKTNTFLLFAQAFLGFAALSSVHAQSSGIQIFVNTAGRTPVTLDVEFSDSIENVKTKIQDKLGAQPNQQALFFLNMMLEDARTLADYPVQQGSTLQLYPALFQTTIPFDFAWDGDSTQTIRFADYHAGQLNVTWTTIDGVLDLSTASAAHPITLSLFTSAFAHVAAQNFDADSNATWTIATASGGINGFSADQFTFDTSGFLNSFNPGGFAIAPVGNDLVLSYTAAPEPSVTALLIGAGTLILALGQRRFRKA